MVQVQVGTSEPLTYLARIDTGCPISLIKQSCIRQLELINKVGREWNKYYGINRSKLRVIGNVKATILLETDSKNMILGVVPEDTMSVPILLGRNAIRLFKYKLTKDLEYNKAVTEIFNISEMQETAKDKININRELEQGEISKFQMIFENYYTKPERPKEPKVRAEAIIKLKEASPIQFGPRRLSYIDKENISKIIDNLQKNKIIRPSNSEYASPIVLTRKKNGEIRMCIDFRALNKIMVRDNYPLPLIEDQLDMLRDKKFFSKLDLKDGFYHVAMAPDSIKYTSFITPLGQFEFTRMPFGLKIGPQRFQRFINEVMSDAVKSGNVVVYMDDILIANDTLEAHFNTLKIIFTILVENKLELRLEKCLFLVTEIEYLGYIVTREGIRPTDSGVAAVRNFPEPKTIKEVHSFVGLASYFRKFIEKFAIIAKPLYLLLRKGVTFNFGEAERSAFQTLKLRLTEAPTLTIYNPKRYTELHCDASAHGFGAILLQQLPNKKMHPVFYFSKRTTEPESKYHSFELETLAIVYALRRFRIYLQGIPFTIVSDCSAVTRTLEKRDINARIARWSLELQSFDFKVTHRRGSQMEHVDALSRSFGILVIEDNPFEWNLMVLQSKDAEIKQIAIKLETTEDSQYELRNGLVYKKQGNKLLFLVPVAMEQHVLFRYHNEMGHVGINKMMENIRTTYWFPNIKEKCERHVRNCLKCISFSPGSGKGEGVLHPIAKGRIPFEMIHVDHVGPMDKQITIKKYILVVVDAFSRFVRLYATKTTSAKEAIVSLTNYFQCYNTPTTLVSDRGSCFTAGEFEEFIRQYNIKHIKVATGSPQANGQAERINRSLVPMIAKLNNSENGKQWYKMLGEVEYCINNTVNKSTGKSPSQLVFGLDQRGPHADQVKEQAGSEVNASIISLVNIREAAIERMQREQQKQKLYYDRRHKAPLKYQIGDLVMVKNFDSTPGTARKLIPKFRGPYEIKKILGNDRYLLIDVPGFQNTQKLYTGTWAASNLRPWLTTSATE